LIKAVIKKGIVVNKIVADNSFEVEGAILVDVIEGNVNIGDRYEKIDGEYVFIKDEDDTTSEPAETELLTDYILDIDYRVTLMELSLL